MTDARIEEYAGPAGVFKAHSDWLCAEDLPPGKDVAVTISRVVRVTGAEFEQGRKVDGGALEFVGKRKRLLLNATNRKMLVRLFGAMTGQWKGRTILLYIDPHVQMMGKRVCGVRIRDTVPKAEDADTMPVQEDDAPTLAQVAAVVKAVLVEATPADLEAAAQAWLDAMPRTPIDEAGKLDAGAWLDLLAGRTHQE